MRVLGALIAVALVSGGLSGCGKPAEPRGKVHDVLPPVRAYFEVPCKQDQWALTIKTPYLQKLTDGSSEIWYKYGYVCMTKERAAKYKVGLSFP